MGELFEEALQREDLVRQRDLLGSWIAKGAVVMFGDDGIYVFQPWMREPQLFISAEVFLNPQD